MNQLTKVRALLSQTLPAILLTGAPNRQYATDARIDEGMCLVLPDECIYLTDSRYTEAAERAMAGTGRVERVDREHPYTKRINAALDARGIAALGVEQERLTFGEYTRLSKKLHAALIPCQEAVDGLRAAKEPWEQERLRRAQEKTDAVFSEMLGVIRPGMTEKELEAELIYRLYRTGAEGLSFAPIVVSGPNTSMPHGVAGQRVLREGDFVTMDFGLICEGYCSDMTRTVAIGHVTEEMRTVYNTVLKAQLESIAAAKAGIIGAELHGIADKIISDAGYGEYFGHGLGHSVGIEVHDGPGASPSNPNPIPAGAVVTIEPGIYIPGKFGVRIEDFLLFEEGGNRNLTETPKELLIL